MSDITLPFTVKDREEADAKRHVELLIAVVASGLLANPKIVDGSTDIGAAIKNCFELAEKSFRP